MASIPIPRLPRPSYAGENRDSGLRASILDTAMELGIGNSRTVANWIFNAVEEADEDTEGLASPSLTYASTATTTSGESSTSHAQPGAHINHSPSNAHYSPAGGLNASTATSESRAIHFQFPVPEPRAISPQPPAKALKQNKLRKLKPDGYDSDGGYMSDSGKGKKNKVKAKSKVRTDTDVEATDYESDGGRGKKKEKEKKKAKNKHADSAGIDYETDGGYMSSNSVGWGKSKARTPARDESDGGELSESASKKRRFFRLRTKSSKKRLVEEAIPPVPTLPSLNLPIAGLYARSETTSSTSRTVTPSPSERTVTERESLESMLAGERDSNVNNAERRTGLDDAVRDWDSFRANSMDSSANLTSAIDSSKAESVSSPALDVVDGLQATPMSTSWNEANSPATPTSVTRPMANLPSSGSRFYEAPPPSSRSPKVPVIALPVIKPKPKPHSPPQISAPNTRHLADKHVPVPLILTPPTPVHSTHSDSSPDYIIMTPSMTRPSLPSSPCPANNTPVTDMHRAPTPSGSPSRMDPSPREPPSPSGGQQFIRPHVLAYYDLPPPSPPPQGPLPNVPPDGSSPDRVRSRPSVMRFARPTTADNMPERPQEFTAGDGTASGQPPSSPLRPIHTAPATAASGANARPISPMRPPGESAAVQRGRVSPFPVRPVLPREESSALVRRTSLMLRSVSPANAPRGGPPSAFPHSGEPQEQHVRFLSDTWHSRAATPELTPGDDSPPGSWMEMEDDDPPPDRPLSGESHSDVDEVLAAFEDSRDGDDTQEVYTYDAEDGDDDAGASIYPNDDGRARSRSTLGVDDDDVDADDKSARYSTWSAAPSRTSILDKEKSEQARKRFVHGVVQMFGQRHRANEIIPPVPKLDPSLRGGTR